jgi:hypothetical protein
VLGNEAALTQIFSNLLSNAVRFVAPGVAPDVIVRARTIPVGVRVYVQDNGIGIDPSQQGRIWAIFQRVSKEYEGTGIGLAIVKKAAERMGGRVGVESVPGEGSTFWVDLQLPPPPETNIRPLAVSEPGRRITLRTPGKDPRYEQTQSSPLRGGWSTPSLIKPDWLRGYWYWTSDHFDASCLAIWML